MSIIFVLSGKLQGRESVLYKENGLRGHSEFVLVILSETKDLGTGTVNDVMVQAYWSQSDGNCVIPGLLEDKV